MPSSDCTSRSKTGQLSPRPPLKEDIKNARPACVRSSLARPAVHRRTASQRLRHLRHAHVANCLSSPHPRLDAMQNRGIETELGEPVSKRSWANQYQKRSWADEPGGLGGPSPTRWVSKLNKKTPAATLRRFLTTGGSTKKLATSSLFFDTGAGPSQLKVGTAETILGKGVRHLRHLRHPLNVEQKCLKRVSDLSQQ